MITTGQGATILVVEDPFVRAFVRAYLVRHGHHVVLSEAEEAEERLRSGEWKIDLLITNRPARFAGLTGGAPVLYVAAFPDPAETAGYARSYMLSKPFAPEHLLAAVTSLVGGGVGLV